MVVGVSDRIGRLIDHWVSSRGERPQTLWLGNAEWHQVCELPTPNISFFVSDLDSGTTLPIGGCTFEGMIISLVGVRSCLAVGHRSHV